MIDLEFPQPKDPEDQAWFFMRTEEPVVSIIRATAILSTPTAPRVGGWATPGDKIANGPLTITQQSVMENGQGIALLLSGGIPGQTYAVRARFQTLSGSVLNRSGIIVVTGL